jgi:hypothetical protein
MRSSTDRQRGFHVLPLVVALVVLGFIGFAGWRIMHKQPASKQTSQSTPTDLSSIPTELIWQQTADGWRSTQTAPACPAGPFMNMPAMLGDVTAVLYPGQTRGGNYKPHGGLRFDQAADNNITVSAPLGGFIVRGAQYLAEGEVQYTFDVMNNCGVMYRVGHLRILPDKLMKLTTGWPAPVEGDSRTQQVSPAVYVKPGEILATAVGIIKDKNVFFDWGVYDFRSTNQASQAASYQQAHANDRELSWHAVCWLKGWLPASDSATLRALPAGDPTSGKNSDYCK